MPVKTMNQSLDTRLVEVTQITGRLSTLLTLDEGLGVDRSESVNDDFSTDRLNRVDNYGHTSGVELFE